MAARVEEGHGQGIDLARERPFGLGLLEVFPGTRQIVRDGQASTLEPRIMQVLVALARAEGEILSRNDLTDRCWNGRTVGDNAIHRALSRVREIGTELAGGSFRVETIAKVGYRLLGEYRPEAAGPAAHPTAAMSTETRTLPHHREEVGQRRGWRLAAIAMAAIVLIGGLGAWSWGPWPASQHISIAVAGHRDAGSEGLAREIEVDLGRLAAARETSLRMTDEASAPDYIVRVARGRAGGVDRVDLSLLTGSAGEMLWSTSLEREGRAGTADLRPEVSARVGQVLLCAFGNREGQELPVEVLRLYLSACERMEGLPDQQLLTLLQRVTTAAPGFAEGWGRLAMAEAEQFRILSFDKGSDSSESRATLASAQDHIRRARAIDPDLASASAAEIELIEPRRFAERLARLEQAIEQSDSEPILHVLYSKTLFAVGRLTDAVIAARRAAALDPLSADAQATLVTSLAHAGSPNRARQELATAERAWPGSQQIRLTRFSMELRYGDARVAQQMIDSGQASLSGVTGGFGGAEILMQARLNPSAENIQRMVRFASLETARAPRATPMRIQALGHAGATEAFFAMMDQPGVVENLSNATEVLFRPHLKSFRDDVRFLRVAARVGLLQVWAGSRQWPDFCTDPRLPYDCRREGERILRTL